MPRSGKLIIVTGGAGFIGSRIIAKLNNMTSQEILVVDDLTDGKKMANLARVRIDDYMDADDFQNAINGGFDFGQIDAVFHMGACSATTEWDGQYLMRRNYGYSKDLLHWCSGNSSSLIYASSASVYGDGANGFTETISSEKPINMYAYSKFLFDQYVRGVLPRLNSQVVGLRFFNVYGPHEQHKGSMASVSYHANNQLLETGKIKLFGEYGGVSAGEQRRDFVYVDDCAEVANWFMENKSVSGIFNLGSGKAETFNSLARAVIEWHGFGEIEYIPFPEHLIGSYQNFTQADLFELRNAGCDVEFKTVKQGIFNYLDEIS